MPIRDPRFHLGGFIFLGIRGVLGLLLGLFCVGVGIVRWDAAAVVFGLGVLAFFAAIGAFLAAIDRRLAEATDAGNAEDGGLGRSDGSGEA
jgi:hypothetical protein